MAAIPLLPRLWPVRLTISCLVVATMALASMVLVSLSWVSSRQTLLDSAVLSARAAAEITAERSRRMIDPGSAVLRSLSSDPLVSADTLQARLARVGILTRELVANPLMSAIYVGYENGDFLLARPLDRLDIRQHFQVPPQASFLVQSVFHGANGRPEGSFHFYNAQHDEVQRQSMPYYHFDPRKRPWFTAASNSAATAISGPYLFFSTAQAGISLSRRGHTGKAIVGLDIALDDLGAGLAKLRMTPSAELALVDRQGSVLAYSNTQALLSSSRTTALDRTSTLDELGVEALMQLRQIARDGQVESYQAAGRKWLGIMLPFDAIDGLSLHLLASAPADELLGDLAHNRNNQILIAIALTLLLLPLGWRAGGSIGKALERITAQAQRLSRFDFSRPARAPTRLREVATLNEVADHVSVTVEAFLSISHILGTEPLIDNMLAQVLEKLVSATRCEGGAVYLRQQEQHTMRKAASVGPQETLAATLRDVSESSGPAVETAYQRTDFELRGRRGQLEGLLVLLHADDGDHASPEFQAFTRRLTGMLAVAIETRQLIQAQRQLFDAVIHVLADAIDAKSAYTGGHCERVPKLSIMLADRLAAETSGPYADFKLDEDERYAFHLAAWLHDCGKVTSPEHIVDKATKLETIYDRIHEIRMRFEVLWRDAEIDYLRALLAGHAADAAAGARDERQARLHDDFHFVATCNLGGEFLADETIARLQQIGKTTWLRQFDDSLGLGIEARRRLARARGPSPALPVHEPLLADRPEHQLPWDERKPPVERNDPRNTLGFDMTLPAYRQNLGELHNLSIRRGTLTDEDRFAINDHIVQTLTMLKKLPWPAHLSRVPDIAANHHEKMDGSGYPRRIRAATLPVTDRIMALADVFEALTAADRPYKPAKRLSESLHIMAFMGKEGHLDGELYLYFLHSRTWQAYAQRFLRPEQIDDVDVEALAQIVRDGEVCA